MGNSGSSNHHHHKDPLSHSWVLSYPRNQRQLPDSYVEPRFRASSNGLHLQAVDPVNKPPFGYPWPQPIHNNFRSEPDLRFTGHELMPPGYIHETPTKPRISRSRKKYNAPMPVTNGFDSPSPVFYQHQHWDSSAGNSDGQVPFRKSRLFKTHAQTKAPTRQPKITPLLHKSLSSPQFHEELTEATKRLRKLSKSPARQSGKSRIDRDSSSQSTDSQLIVNSSHVRSNFNCTEPAPRARSPRLISSKNIFLEKSIQPTIETSVPTRIGNLTNSEDSEIPQEMVELKDDSAKEVDTTKHVKMFYFGMEEDPKTNEEDEIERFTELVTRHSPASDSVEEEIRLHDTNNISCHLRPTLPRKQLDIPRFSPTSAWKLLSELESSPSDLDKDNDIVIPQVHDKNVDSGISGDASPNLDYVHNFQAAWTPQQDLEETSSDGGLESSPMIPETIGTNQFGTNQFSLSLPRENSSKNNFTVIQPNDWMSEEKENNPVDENWVLSRSVPSSLHLQRWVDPESEDCSNNTQSLPYFAKARRLMYLPEFQPRSSCHSMEEMSPFSKSLDNLVIHTQHEDDEKDLLSEPVAPVRQKKDKKFTFQSTVRQIERRKIAEKLSKQAEQKEKQRLLELETMQKVEAEFQKKREWEKQDIKQQLRLYMHVLSEYKQPSRDYKDFCSTRTDRSEVNEPLFQVDHPPAVYQMPKNTQVYVVAKQSNVPSSASDSNNYRRDFAQGILPKSGSELSQPTSHNSSSSEQVQNEYVKDEVPKDCVVEDQKPTIIELIPKQNVKLTPVVKDTSPLSAPHLVANISSSSEVNSSASSVIREKTPPPTLSQSNLVFAGQMEELSEKFSKPSKPSVVLTKFLQPFHKNKSYRPISFSPNNSSKTQIAG